MKVVHCKYGARVLQFRFGFNTEIIFLQFLDG